MTDTDLAPSLWTPEEIVAIYRRLLTYCAEHPEDASPRLIGMYQQRMRQAERDAVREKTDRTETARRRQVSGEFVEQMLSDLNAVNAALYGRK
jgi:hypothetical protein